MSTPAIFRGVARGMCAQMERAVARDIQRGLAAVRRLTQEHNISGVHGVLVELFDCIPQLYTAVDVGPPADLSSSTSLRYHVLVALLKYLGSERR